LKHKKERLLVWAAEVRSRWFRFSSLNEFHCRAQHWSLHFALDEELKQFLEPMQVPEGWTLVRAGELDSYLYILQQGSLTAFVEKENKVSRLQVSFCLFNILIYLSGQ
jgi:CRP-like cAMP-binding protein